MDSKKDDSRINSLIFKELIKRGYSVEEGNKVWNIADSKLWYLTPEQAKAYLEAEQMPEYRTAMVEKEVNLLKESIEDMGEEFLNRESVTIVDIGCGDGKKAIVPIEFLKKKGKKVVYCPIDISSYMVDEAKKRISKLDIDELVEFKWNISDFENLENVTPLLRKKNEGLLLLFLGSTLGNFEMHEVLHEIRESMKSKDTILIGVSLKKPGMDPEEHANAYKTKYSDLFLVKVLEQVGFTQEEVEYGTRFNNYRVEGLYTLKKDKKIVLREKSILFKKGDKIIVSVSYKYDKKDFEEALSLYFEKRKTYTNEDETWAVALCKK